MNASRLILGMIGAMVVAGGAALFVRQRHMEGELRAQNQALREQLEQSAQLATENGRLSNLVAQAAAAQRLPDSQLSELLKLRGEVGRLRQQAKEVEALREANRQATAAVAASQKASGTNTASEPASADFWPRDSWQFLGYATPDAALQSQFYAARQGDLKTFMSYTTGEILEAMQKDMEGKSEAEMLDKMNREMKNLKSVRILKRQTLPDGTVALTAFFEDGDHTHESSLILKKVGNEWKIAGKGSP
jgi:hypothetical protein